MTRYFDIHSHVNFPEYDEDREEVLSVMKEQGVSTITVGTTLTTSREALALAHTHSHVYATVGIHPNETEEATKESLQELVTQKKVVAIGECGLDFFRTPKDQVYEHQAELFSSQIDLAHDYNLPLMIHARASYKEVYELLKKSHEAGKHVRGNMHFFAGTLEDARRFLDLGFTLSFTGVLTFARDYDEVVKFAPLSMIMSETDAPYASPVPYRGKRNNPLYVQEVVRAIARIRGEEEEYVANTLYDNALRHFGLKEEK